MADRPLFTNEAALAGGNAIGISIANPDADPTPIVAKIRLFDQTLVPDQGTTRADFVAAETTLTGYPAGGYTLSEFADAVFAPLGGSVITGNLINVAYASGPSVQIGGYWVEDASTPTPKVRDSFIYDPPRTLGQVGDGFPIAVQMGYGRNSGS